MKGSGHKYRWTIRKRLIALILLISIAFFLFPGYEFLVERDRSPSDLMFIIAAGLVAIGSGILLSRTIETPLRELTRAARAVADGDLTVRLLAQPDDEFGELADSFNRMVAALEASQEERQRRLDELALLHEATMALSQSLQLDRLADALAQVLERLLPYEYAEVFLIEEATGELIPFLVREHRTAVERMDVDEDHSTLHTSRSTQVRALGEGISGWVAQHNQPVRLGDVREQSDPPYMAQRPDIRSILCVPLHIGKWAVGAIKLESVELNAYSEHHEQLLMALAGQLAVAIENARLFREIGQRAAELAHRNLDLAALLDLSQSLTLTLEPDRLYEIVLTQAVAAIAPAAGGMLWLHNPINDALELAGVYGYNSGGQWSLTTDNYLLRPGEATIGAAYASGTPLRLTSPADFEPYYATTSPEILQLWNAIGRAQEPRDLSLPSLVSQICVPLAAQGQIIGCLNLDTFNEPIFSEADLSLLQAMANQAAVAIENARLFAAITDSREQLRALSAQIVQAQEEERRRLARELHDEIGQALTAIALDLGMMAQLLPQPNEAVKRAIEDAQTLSQNALEEVRRLSVELRPSILDDLGLVPALRWYIDRHAERTGMRSRFEEIGLDERLPAEIETVCYRAVQEALTNIARHASAQNISVCLERERGRDSVALTITDDGVGFDVSRALRRARAGDSLGLLGLHERVELLGGSLRIRSQSGEGTSIQIQLPIQPALAGRLPDD